MPRDFPVRGLFQGHEACAAGVSRCSRLRRTPEWSLRRSWTCMTIRDGKVLRVQGYLDRAEALEAAGLSE
jgi:ketosteroid isomerase-like protein